MQFNDINKQNNSVPASFTGFGFGLNQFCPLCNPRTIITNQTNRKQTSHISVKCFYWTISWDAEGLYEHTRVCAGLIYTAGNCFFPPLLIHLTSELLYCL